MKDLILFFSITLSVVLIGSLKESKVNQDQTNKLSLANSVVFTANK